MLICTAGMHAAFLLHVLLLVPLVRFTYVLHSLVQEGSSSSGGSEAGSVKAQGLGAGKQLAGKGGGKAECPGSPDGAAVPLLCHAGGWSSPTKLAGQDTGQDAPGACGGCLHLLMRMAVRQ